MLSSRSLLKTWTLEVLEPEVNASDDGTTVDVASTVSTTTHLTTGTEDVSDVPR